MTDSQTSLLAALGVSGKELTLVGHSFKLYELEAVQVGILLDEAQGLDKAGLSVIKQINEETGAEEAFFQRNYLGLAAAAKPVLLMLVGFSLGFDQELDALDVAGRKAAALSGAGKIATKHLPKLLAEIYEVNKSFFGELIGTLQQMGLIGADVAANLSAFVTSGQGLSPASSGAATA